MTKKLEQILDLAPSEESYINPKEAQQLLSSKGAIDLQEKLEEFDKISAALPRVKGLGDMADGELDALAAKAEQAYDDLMDLGMNVEVRYGARMFEVAANMMNAAIQAKSAKIDKKLKMVELQLKKLAIDKKHSEDEKPIEAEGYIISDRNTLLQKLKNMNK